MTKQIQCCRCKRFKVVPSSWTFKECESCHSRTVRKSANMTGQQLENLAVRRLIDFESAWKKYKRFCHTWKAKPKPKAEYEEEWMAQQKPRIANINSIIAKYGSEFPLNGTTCLHFRSMLTDKNSNSEWQPKDDDELNIWGNHLLHCQNCTSYYQAHKSDDPMQTLFCEDGVSQQEFDRSLTDFYSVFQKPKDGIDAYLDRMTDVCMICGRNKVTLPNGKIICSHCEPEG